MAHVTSLCVPALQISVNRHTFLAPSKQRKFWSAVRMCYERNHISNVWSILWVKGNTEWFSQKKPVTMLVLNKRMLKTPSKSTHAFCRYGRLNPGNSHLRGVINQGILLLPSNSLPGAAMSLVWMLTHSDSTS